MCFIEIDFKKDVLLARISRVVDKETGEEMRLAFSYANDETGEYRFIDETGRETVRWGNIQIVERPLAGKATTVGKEKGIRMIVEKLKLFGKKKTE
ncbi:MAG: hypothetical protein R6U50_11295 [Desulfobacterales bacterium]